MVLKCVVGCGCGAWTGTTQLGQNGGKHGAPCLRQARLAWDWESHFFSGAGVGHMQSQVVSRQGTGGAELPAQRNGTGRVETQDGKGAGCAHGWMDAFCWCR